MGSLDFSQPEQNRWLRTHHLAQSNMSLGSPHRILIVDDDARVRKILRECFTDDGFAVFEAQDGGEMHACLQKEAVDLITLDLKLGGEDGLALAREVRSRQNLPIIIITGKGKAIDRVAGLELGADDYIAKPFHLRETLARVRAVLRRYDHPHPTVVHDATARFGFNGCVLDRTRRQLVTASGDVELTTTEFNLLELFLTYPQRVLTRNNIMDMLKGHDWSPLDRSIDSAVARLRKKIEPELENNLNLIKTVHGVGYVFTGDVTRL